MSGDALGLLSGGAISSSSSGRRAEAQVARERRGALLKKAIVCLAHVWQHKIVDDEQLKRLSGRSALVGAPLLRQDCGRAAAAPLVLLPSREGNGVASGVDAVRPAIGPIGCNIISGELIGKSALGVHFDDDAAGAGVAVPKRLRAAGAVGGRSGSSCGGGRGAAGGLLSRLLLAWPLIGTLFLSGWGLRWVGDV